MAAFVEALLKERLWYWLETEKNMEVEGEVQLGTGRIDLVAKTPNGEIWGIELKKSEGTRFGSTLYDQAHRYIESGLLDRVFFASSVVDGFQKAFFGSQSPDIMILSQISRRLGAGIIEGNYSKEEVLREVDQKLPESFLSRQISPSPSIREYIESKLEIRGEPRKSPISIEEGITKMARAQFPKELGVIHVPLNLDNDILREVEKNIVPGRAYEPHILRQGDRLERTGKPEFSRHEEPWIRHCCWREYGGFPEGHIPNQMESDQAYRPIDLLAFPESYDPTDTIKEPDLHDIVGIEAKGESSYQPKRIIKQLSEFLATETLSRLYLAVPSSLAPRAVTLIEGSENLDVVGVFSVDESGEFTVERYATIMAPKHDGYIEKHQLRKVGYGEIQVEGQKDVVNPFVTDEEAERLKNPDASAYAHDILTDNSEIADSDGWIRATSSRPIRPPESDFNQQRARAYLLEGRSADPYTEDSNKGIGPRDMKEGYVRLTVSDFAVDEEFALKLHFGRGSWEGGYIWLAGCEVDNLQDILKSLKTISGGEVTGQGKVLDLDIYPFDYSKNEPHRVSGGSGEESRQKLRITSTIGEDSAAKFRLGESKNAGVNVSISQPQWLDLVATIDILQNGNHRELPGEFTSCPRIGPNGEDTWSIGSDIEEQIHPSPPAEW